MPFPLRFLMIICYVVRCKERGVLCSVVLARLHSDFQCPFHAGHQYRPHIPGVFFCHDAPTIHLGINDDTVLPCGRAQAPIMIQGCIDQRSRSPEDHRTSFKHFLDIGTTTAEVLEVNWSNFATLGPSAFEKITHSTITLHVLDDSAYTNLILPTTNP